MEFIIFFISFFAALFFIGLGNAGLSSKNDLLIKFSSFGFVTIFAVVIWTIVAVNSYEPKEKVSYFEFKTFEGEVFYKGFDGKLVKCNSDLQYVDTQKYILKNTKYEGDWHMGILISDRGKWEVVEKASIEKHD